ncbi:hypothetical protein AMATHDRAFT_46783 [Amanita thiersii Skay4041]|uniref:ZW10 C-terminal helical domain-containing protein n=1 Tax=Amanita thiersii Skay4041 TaxID=703135 RepID=A0A2A9NVP3_9AGAR|nr:hypothetical protein AMATHDRAFT_46783 [Amanita thiersii Skay4041]
MAFPIPDHLPRRAVPQDVSSKILNTIDTATTQSLNAELARSWLAELDESINATKPMTSPYSAKQRIRERIQSDLPNFERQLASSKSVRERFHVLKTNVDELHQAVSSPQTGLISTLERRLNLHTTLTQEAANAAVLYQALSHLSRCYTQYSALEALAQAGKLPEAVAAYAELDTLLISAPVALDQAKVMTDLKRKARAAQALTEEQLSDAYSRSILITSNDILIYPSIQVRQSDSVLSLTSILSSLTPQSLTNHLSTLRRDLTSHLIDHIVKEPCSIMVETDIAGCSKLKHIPAPPNTEDRSSRLKNLSLVLDFLQQHLFPHLPTSHSTSFLHSLCKPLTNSVLTNLLQAFLPSSFEKIPPYLDLVNRATAFEDVYIVRLLGNDTNDKPIQIWAHGIGGHYERQRRLQILDKCRSIILLPADEDYFLDEIELVSENVPSSVIAVQEQDSKNEDKQLANVDPWGLEDNEGKSGTSSSVVVDEDSWGFDDDIPSEQDSQVEPEKEASPLVEEEPDPGDAWGWNEDDLSVDDSTESVWDDPWGETSGSDQFKNDSYVDTRSPPAPSITQPKAATRLEKMATKTKKHMNGDAQPAISMPSPSLSSASQQANLVEGLMPKSVQLRPPEVNTSNSVKESYRVSGRMRRLMSLVEDVLQEGRHLSMSNIFTPQMDGYHLGITILQTAPSVLDLFRALYPVKYASELASPEKGMVFSNDCLYLSGQVEQLTKSPAHEAVTVLNKLEESKHHLKILGESWYDDIIEKQRETVNDTLTDGAKGFIDSADQDRYDECESAVNQVLQHIKRLATKLKGSLTKSKYYTVIGLVTEAALSRILGDILALPDIPEIESHRLSELCKFLNALEGLFVEDPSQPSFVVAYVPSWLKFSYLSELLEASMADISYLFEEGALVDFSVDELVRLVRALFADTNLRTNTITKILNEHPVTLH